MQRLLDGAAASEAETGKGEAEKSERAGFGDPKEAADLASGREA